MTDMELAEEIERKLGNMAEDFRWAITFSSSKWQQIIAALRRGHEPKRAMIDDVPLCAGHADWWFTSRNHLKGDTSCVVCAFNPERPPSGEMVMVPIFTAICPKCDASYEHEGMPTEASLRAGTFCPNCKEAGYNLVGILHWKVSAAEAEGRKS